jgi:hypothetical protein
MSARIDSFMRRLLNIINGEMPLVMHPWCVMPADVVLCDFQLTPGDDLICDRCEEAVAVRALGVRGKIERRL